MQFKLLLSTDHFAMSSFKLKHFRICRLISYKQLMGLANQVCFVKYLSGWGWWILLQGKSCWHRVIQFLYPPYHGNYNGPESELLPGAKFLLKEASAADLYPLRDYIVKIISWSWKQPELSLWRVLKYMINSTLEILAACLLSKNSRVAHKLGD